ncbi:MAG TPA: HD domain-containing phosphohydrolase [Tepidisphaeraceae bacterium]|nr:HD domain-containing phosphohydrolase [Tepidisphaeraceae bacterium]
MSSTIPTVVMDNLASRFRPSSMFIIALNSDGSVAYHDPAAGLFFQRYVLPMIQWRETFDPEFRQLVGGINAGSNISIWKFVPGVCLAAFPFVQRKQMSGILVLAAKSPDFKLSEDVVSVCGRLGLDGIWLSQQADELNPHKDDVMQRVARLLLSMVRDQIRLTSLEKELDSLSNQLSNTYEELSLIYQLSSGMRVNRSPNDFFKQACLDVMELMGVRGMGVALRTDTTASQPPVLYGAMSLPPGQIHRLADDLMNILRVRKSPLLINNLREDKQLGWLGEYAHQLLAVPLQRQDQVLGCLFGLDKLSDEFDTVDSKLLNSIANESAIYLENSMLYEDVRGLLMGLLHSLVSAVDAKDAYTCGHSERVALLSRLLAQQAQLGDHVVERIYMAGLLHDVGKIGVPEAVLQKTGRLTAEEFEQIKKHPEIGARILRDIKQIEDVIPGVLHHHERFDGKGYPGGLAGEAIPLVGRVICLADCFDAMTSSRTYRKAMPLEAALAEIRRCSGTQFDPKLTDAFLSIGADRFRDLLTDHSRQTKQLIEMQQSLRAA